MPSAAAAGDALGCARHAGWLWLLLAAASAAAAAVVTRLQVLHADCLLHLVLPALHNTIWQQTQQQHHCQMRVLPTGPATGACFCRPAAAARAGVHLTPPVDCGSACALAAAMPAPAAAAAAAVAAVAAR